jgi:hypothetical protein
MSRNRNRNRSQRLPVTPLVATQRSRKVTQKTVVNTCHVTGELRNYRLSVVTVDEGDRIHYPHEPGWLNGYRVALPLRLHVGTPDGIGAPRSSPQMQKYWGELWNGKPKQAAATYQETHWWALPWAERELFAYFPAEAVMIVLAVHRDGQSWDAAMQGSSMATADVVTLKREMARHIRQILRTSQQAA